MNTDTKMFEDLLAFLKKAGDYALNAQDGVRSHFKPGDQIVTETDLAVARMAREQLGHWFAQDGHVLIEEESLDTLPTPQELFANTTYQWVLDPIDGTAGYAMGRELWGITLGIFKNGQPWMGGIILPRRRMLVATDGTTTLFETWDDAGQRTTRPIPPVHTHRITGQTFIDGFVDRGWHADRSLLDKIRQGVWLNSPESAVDGAVNTLLGRSGGMTFSRMFSLWDIAGFLAIARQTGHTARNPRTDEHWDTIRPEHLTDAWKLKDGWVVCAPDNYQTLKEIFTS